MENEKLNMILKRIEKLEKELLMLKEIINKTFITVKRVENVTLQIKQKIDLIHKNIKKMRW